MSDAINAKDNRPQLADGTRIGRRGYTAAAYLAIDSFKSRPKNDFPGKTLSTVDTWFEVAMLDAFAAGAKWQKENPDA